MLTTLWPSAFGDVWGASRELTSGDGFVWIASARGPLSVNLHANSSEEPCLPPRVAPFRLISGFHDKWCKNVSE
ncbi:unnamed protein product [Nesidiocoris tenuis]|uniref:Uncharacterized protein n=1 Tax=Nesidiocoris tenuis TaxID=355587 RepID=A0A6H5H325_9HEMI|nr:unnamed protein product [Nesidiocoris tenuis]